MKTKGFSLLILLFIIIFTWFTKNSWLPYILNFLSPVDNRAEFIQTLESIINITSFIFSLILSYLSWLNLRPKQEEKDDIKPLLQTTTDELLLRLGQIGSQVKWLNRGATSPSLLRSQGLVVITGPIKIGKTREAVELIRNAVIEDLVPNNRIYLINPNIRSYTKGKLRQLISINVDPGESIILFIDDLPRHYYGEHLSLLSEVINCLKECKEYYVVATARKDQLTKEYLDWLKNQGFGVINLQPFTKKQAHLFVDVAVKSTGLQIDDGVALIFANRSYGSPEAILIGLRRLLAEGHTQIDQALALRVTSQSLYDAWGSARRYIIERQELSEYVLESLATFFAAGVTPITTMILAYTEFLYKNKKGSRLSNYWKVKRKLGDALNYLIHFDTVDIGGQLVFPDIAVEGVISTEEAIEKLGFFLENHRLLFTISGLRWLYRQSSIHAACLFDLAINAHSRGDFRLAIRFYNSVMKRNPSGWSYLNRGSAYAELDKFDEAITDFSKSISILTDPLSKAFAYSNRSRAYLDKGDFEKALADIETATSLVPDFMVGFRNRGIILGLMGNYSQALNDLDQAIKGLPDGIDRAGAFFQRGEIYLKLGKNDQAIEDFTDSIRYYPNFPNKAYVFRRRAQTYRLQGDLTRALHDLTSALVIDPNEAITYLERGVVYGELNQQKKAMIDFDKAALLDPTLIAAISMEKAKLALNTNNYGQAIMELDRAIPLLDVVQYQADAYMIRGIAFVQSGNVEKALSDLNYALSINPNLGVAYLNRAKLFIQTKDFNRVIGDCDEAIRLLPDDLYKAHAFNYQGFAFDELERYDEALRCFSHAIEFYPGFAEAFMNRGITFIKQGEFNNALSDLTQAINLQSNLWEAYANRGNAYLEIGNYKNAVNDLTKAIKNLPDGWSKALSYRARGNSYVFMENYSRAIIDFSKAISLLDAGPEKANSYFRRAVSYSIQGKDRPALEDLNRSISIDPNFFEAYILRARHLRQTENYEQAILDLTMALTLVPDKREGIEAYDLRGEIYLEVGEFEKAISDLDTIIDLNPENPENFYNRGLIYLLSGSISKAIIDFEEAILLKPDYATAYNSRGLAFGKQGNLDLALSDFKRSIELFGDSPERVMPFRNMALAYIEENRLSEAEDAFRIVESIAPKDKFTIATKGELVYAKGEYEEALSLFLEAEELSTVPYEFRINMALPLFYLNKDEEAIEAINKYIANKPIPVILQAALFRLEQIMQKEANSEFINRAVNLIKEYLDTGSPSSLSDE